eukprot:13440750-Alexandrium_andersonii.AAC.1
MACNGLQWLAIACIGTPGGLHWLARARKGSLVACPGGLHWLAMACIGLQWLALACNALNCLALVACNCLRWHLPWWLAMARIALHWLTRPCDGLGCHGFYWHRGIMQ